jgi:hypothetical protein
MIRVCSEQFFLFLESPVFQKTFGFIKSSKSFAYLLLSKPKGFE